MTHTGEELYHGLAAMSWGLLDLDEDRHQQDFPFFQRVVAENGGLALDVGCGTGRLLKSLLKAGLAVEGCDISTEMLAYCQRNLAQAGLETALYASPMQTLNLPKRYRTIIIPCASFTLVTDFASARATLKTLYNHLEEGGELVFNVFMTDFDYSAETLPDLPGEWRFHFEVTRPSDGAVLKVYRRQVGLDPWAQISQEERRYELHVDGTLQQEESHVGAERWYFPNELRLMMETAGFRDVVVKQDYSDDPTQPIAPYVMIVRGTR